MSYGNHVDKYFVLECRGGLDVTGCKDGCAIAIQGLRHHLREHGYKRSSVDSFIDALREYVDGFEPDDLYDDNVEKG